MPRLSIIVPTLNEASRIRTLIKQIAGQTLAADCEVIIADAGSDDGTMAQARLCAEQAGVACIQVASSRGRGAQMNRGAQVARSPDILFLHADCELPHPDMLAEALTAMAIARRRLGSRVAGHFSLRFSRNNARRSLGYYFFEAKTVLNRPECINGDQGMWFSADYFAQLGEFDTSLEYMEDARLARRVFADGHWITLPGYVVTSARRFESEGFFRRQALNAMLRTCDAVGLEEFLSRAIMAYREQRNTDYLRLMPLLATLDQVLREKKGREALVDLKRAGRFITEQAWQLAFWWDCRQAFRADCATREIATPTLARFDRWIAPIVTRAPAVISTTAALMIAWSILGVVRIVRKYT